MQVKIKNIHIQSFKSIEDLTIRLNDGLNILIGDNGAGKSNFFQFIVSQISYDFRRIRHRAIGLGREDSFKSTNYSIDIEYNHRGDSFMFTLSSQNKKIRKGKSGFENHRTLKFSKHKNGKIIYKDLEFVYGQKTIDKISNDNLKKLRLEIEKIQFSYVNLIGFDTPDDIQYITSPGKFTIYNDGDIEEDSGDSWSLSLFLLFDIEVGENIKEDERVKKSVEEIKNIIISTFESKKRENKYALLLKKFTPISDIRLNENLNIYRVDNKVIVENIVLNFKINGNWVPWSFLSDGTKRLFIIITEILLHNYSSLILIEEPELGIHPAQLFKLMDFLKSQSENKQIIISTHSPISLDVLLPEQLDDIIIAKMTRKGTKMTHLSPVQKSKAQAYIKKVGSLSDYWLHSDLEK